MNAFEAAARAAKVDRILRAVPVGATREELDTIAAWLEAMSPADRAAFAKAAGCKTAPSDATWAAVVSEADARQTVEELEIETQRVFARFGAVSR